MKTQTVADYMTSPPVTLSPDQDLSEAMRLLLRESISGAPVVDRSARLVGMLSSKDCLRVAYNASYHQEPGGLVRDYMTSRVETMDASTDIVAAAERFLQSTYRRFPVMREGKLAGVISRNDILGALLDMWSSDRD